LLPVRIAIDYTPAYEQGGGIGRLVREMVAALALVDSQTDYRLFIAGTHTKNLPPPPGHNFRWHPTRITPEWLARLWHRARLPVPVTVFTGDVALYHATDFVLPPLPHHVPGILTVHDLSFARVPQAAKPSLKAYLDVVVPRSIKRAAHVIADSQATKDDIVALYSTPPEKISVVLSGVESRFQRVTDPSSLLTMRNKYRIGDRPYLLSVGTVQPRKNYSRVIQALAHLRAQGYDLALVIAGGKGWLEDEMYQTIAAAKMQEFVHLIGFADDADLPMLYSAAACVVFPSLYEGFGFPVLEGMACGTPVVTAHVSSLPEVAGDAALMVDPLRVDEIAHAVQRVLDDSALRTDLIQRGYERIKGFTWANSARQLHQIYYNILGKQHV
jgi:glycosyltransferase involved in cell wall biosynthesis